MLRKVPSVRIEGGRARLAADRSQPSPTSPARTLVTHRGTLRSAELCRAAVTRREGVVVARFADGRSVDGVFPRQLPSSLRILALHLLQGSPVASLRSGGGL